MTTFRWRFHFHRNTWTRINPLWLSSGCLFDCHVLGASLHYRRTLKDNPAFRLSLDFLTTARSYSRNRNMNTSDEDPPAKRRKSSSDSDHHLQKDRLSPNGKSPPRKKGAASSPTAEVGRRWEEFTHARGKLPGASGGTRQHFDFSVMSYNILSQQLLHENSYLYRHCSVPVLDWKYRYANIMKEIEEHNADILCLQEVQEDHYVSQMKPSLEALGYQCEYKKRTGGKPDGCAVVFKRDSFALLSGHPVEYLRPGVPLLDRDNVGMVLLLQPNTSTTMPSPLCVANTDLLSNPRRGDIKLAQVAMLLAELRRVASRPDGTLCPLVVCGDMNSVPWSPLYRFLRDGRLDYYGIFRGEVSGQDAVPRRQHPLTVPLWPHTLGINAQCQYHCQSNTSGLTIEEFYRINRPCIQHGFSFSSAYSHRSSKRGEPEVTTNNMQRPLTVDYIFYTAASRFTSDPSSLYGEGLQLLARLSLFDVTDLSTVGGLPNASHPSDHLPLLARFRLHSRQQQQQQRQWPAPPPPSAKVD
ncbi:protein angel homolog 2 [Engraulis encrasicolus]|uniref:protein angel homolog 2 n=1 Tax=Engraulis encrasicolus TaxID=184585 RepID=UPI002FD34AF8